VSEETFPPISKYSNGSFFSKPLAETLAPDKLSISNETFLIPRALPYL